MTDKEKIELEIAVQHLRNIRNNLPTVSMVKSVNTQYHLEQTWIESMYALSLLEKMTK